MGLRARDRLTANNLLSSCRLSVSKRFADKHNPSVLTRKRAARTCDYGRNCREIRAAEFSWDAGANLVAEGSARWMPTRMTSRHFLNLRDSKPDSDMSNISLNRVHHLIDMTGED